MTEATIRRRFIEAIESKNSLFDSYNDSNENTIVLTWNGGDNADEIEIYVSFKIMDDDAVLASISCYDFPNFTDNYYAGLAACNKLNDDELVKYYIDEDGDAVSNTVLLFNSHNIESDFDPNLVLIAATTMAMSADDAFPVLEEI